MSGRHWRLFVSVAFLITLCMVFVRGSSAQSTFTVALNPPDTSKFPQISAYLDVHDPSGGFVHNLTAQDVTLQENGIQVPVNGLIEKKPGVQFVIAIAPGSTYGIRDASGTTRYEYLLQGLQAGLWLQQPAGEDDFSLLTMGGPQVSHSSDPAMLGSMMASFQPDDPKTIPNLETLAAALQVASDPTIRPGMERAILFITPPQSADVSLGLQSIIVSANQQRIHIYVWLVAPAESFNLPEIDLLRNLAAQTSGTFFAFSHDEPVPDLETVLEPLRYVYQLGYASQAAKAGKQELVAQVNIGGNPVSSLPQAYELSLQAPEPVFVNPPVEITRNFSAPATAHAEDAAPDLQPAEEQLDIQISFPDGYVRSLTRTSLYVDGTLVAENAKPPFDKLIWDLRPYTQGGAHKLRVEAMDNLGWVGKTPEILVKITVPTTTQEVVTVVSQKRVLVIGITVLISGSILVLVLIIGGRIRPKPYPGQITPAADHKTVPQATGYRQRLRQLKDPVTQPVKIGSILPAKFKAARKVWEIHLPWQRRAEKPVAALAQLIPLLKADEPTLPAPMQIISHMVTVGSDPQKASLVIADPSIEGVHATLLQEGKTFRITDTGSVAGTWVNYLPASSSGTLLDHADIIHLGRVGFRFILEEPSNPRKVIITPAEPKQ